jgi:acyl-CoA synthetase (AMP-forming)/AMP-acid ligase II
LSKEKRLKLVICLFFDSRFPDIPIGPYPPLYEFVSQNWKPHGGYLDDKVAIIDGSTGLTRTFHDYYTTSTGVAGALRYEFDITEHSSVAMYCPNHVDYAPIVLAVTLCGGKIVPINPMYTSNELSKVLDGSRSSVLIAHASKLDVALTSAKECTHVKHVVVITDDDDAPVPEGTTALNAIRNHKHAFHETRHDIHNNTETYPACLPYSSGTTGLPKGVCLTHANLVANLLQCDIVEGMSFPESHKLISPLPFFHIYAFTVSMLYPAWKGQTVITKSGKFDLELFCKLVEEHKPQRSHLVPPILLGLAKHPVVDTYDLSSLRCIISAAAPMSRETEFAVKKRIGIEVIKQAWGMSELSPIGTINSDFDAKSGSVGPLAPSTYGKVIDEHGKSLPPNTPGELVIKGPQVMMGYLDQPDKTLECLSESGWLRTGDVATYDEEGYFYITDRIKELIKVRGYPVAPAELEALLLTHEAINDAAVIQVPDKASGELPCAYVVLKENFKDVIAQEDIYDWVKERVAPYKRLDGGVEFIDSIPKSASGKILRRILRDQMRSDLEEFEQCDRK